MNLSAKSISLLVIIVVGVSTGFFGAFLILSSEVLRENAEEDPVDFPVSTPVSSPVSFGLPENNSDRALQFAIITSQSTIQIIFDDNEEQIINLSQYQWEDITISPNGRNIAVLGDPQQEGLFDLYIYNLDTETWTQSTSHRNEFEETGISSYIWLDDEIILYTQGQQPNHWLHTYEVASQERLKVQIVDGKLLSISPDKERLLFESIDEDVNPFFFTTIQGEFMFRVNAPDIQEIFFTTNENILFTNSVDPTSIRIKKNFFGAEVFSQIEGSENKQIICSTSEDIYTYNTDDTQIESLSLDEDIFTPVIEYPFINSTLYCFNSFIIANDSFDETISNWYLLNIQNGSFSELTEFANSQEIVSIPADVHFD